ncbi:MAG TPA: flagellar biosynthesis anti-sigma factor FlgM [Terriglobales bacterium]|jgi:flagellar biosynthesis anti-sigma factor FlgM|nr:flagellar biosynthesis anti-sigma factor FlgM [Terriglobales bacterium]
MRVDLNSGGAIAESAGPKSAQSRSHAAGGPASDNSEFSANEASVTSLAAAALHAPEVRTAKVEALRTAIATGTYHVSPHQIAASIVEQLRTRKPTGG